MAYTDNHTLLNAVTTTTTSNAYDVSLRKQISVVFTAASITSGNGVFTIDGSNDGINWVTGVAFLDASSTASTTLVVSKTLSADGSAGAIVTPGFRLIRVKATVTTDGAYTAVLSTYGE